ncbi:uncharacterized protein LOC112560399 isoform X2 [Pomacea canaliculata]|uniref:uncharacterized protein LOC112560399 isoform X2 n=1 Tax=Pomacea canaliculata TaxID=400727 RepID=UPI000D7396E4|nr:uncharacterized protein LOC112560399 isoform X2 [Pomacea canaliculata]
MRLALFVACLPPSSAISRAKPYIILSSPHRTTMLSAGTTFLCVSLLCFSSLCILADDKREAVLEEARQVPKQDVEEVSLEDRSAQIIRAQDAEEGAENPWRDEDLGDVAEPSGIQESTQCMSPSPPDNGFIAGSDFREGARVHVLCEEGYVLTGPSELTCIACTFCSSGGIWSPEEKYSCERIQASLKYVL